MTTAFAKPHWATHIEHALASQLGSPYEHMEIHMLHAPNIDNLMPKYQVTTPITYPIAKRLALVVGTPKHHETLWLSVKAYQYVWQTNTRLKKETPLTSRAFKHTLRDIAGSKQAPASRLPEHFSLKSSLLPGGVVYRHMLTKDYCVQKGLTMPVVVKTNAIQILIPAIAKANGRVGDAIPFKQPDNNETFSALIKTCAQAEVVE